ncbi:MAG: hypothetical protein MUD12_06635 [Spirochaetes bacterium]|jgi:hypothetical protein|nr:hypothetical protein [Spirochaetota bacterium]
MTGTIAQLVFLATHCNCYLRDSLKNELLDSNTTLRFCNMVRFIYYVNNNEAIISKSASEWFSFLKNNNVKYLKLHYESVKKEDRNLAGFVGGGGRWLVEAKKDNGSDFYEGTWKVTDPNNINKKIWSVSYGRIVANLDSNADCSADLKQVKNKLIKDLNEILIFAKENDLSYFSGCFENGLDCLTSNDPFGNDAVYHKDLIPDGYLCVEAVQILAACHVSWVFGGMGSWNDMGFEGEKQNVYENVSGNLFNDINIGIVSAVNSSL